MIFCHLMNQGPQIELYYREVDSLDRQFQQILVELAGDQSMARFKHEYNKLYCAFKRSHENQKILYDKNARILRDFAKCKAKIDLALKLKKEDVQSISFLKQQVTKTYKVLERSKEREEKAKRKIQAMKSKIESLYKMVSQFDALCASQYNAIKDLTERNQSLTKQKDKPNQTLPKIQSELSENHEKLRTVDSEKMTIQLTLKSLEKDINEIDQKLRNINAEQ